MKYYIIAGEPSGDIYGSRLIKEILQQNPKAKIRCWGGDLMKNSGGELVMHYKDLAFMGFLEVLKNIFKILKNLSFCKKDILKFKPDKLIFIDYPGFNLRIAKWAKKKSFKNYFVDIFAFWSYQARTYMHHGCHLMFRSSCFLFLLVFWSLFHKKKPLRAG